MKRKHADRKPCRGCHDMFPRHELKPAWCPRRESMRSFCRRCRLAALRAKAQR